MEKNCYTKNDIKFKNKNEIIPLSKICELFKKLKEAALVINEKIFNDTDEALNKNCDIELTFNEIIDIFYNMSLTVYNEDEYEKIRKGIITKINNKFNTEGYYSIEEIPKENYQKEIIMNYYLKEIYLIITNYAEVNFNNYEEKILHFISKIRKQLIKQGTLDYRESIEELYNSDEKIKNAIINLLNCDFMLGDKLDENIWISMNKKLYSLENCITIEDLNEDELDFMEIYLIDSLCLVEATKEDLPLIMNIYSRFKDETKPGLIIRNILHYKQENSYDYCNILKYVNKHEINDNLPLIRQFEIRILNGENTDDIYENLDKDEEKDLLVKAYYNLLNKGYLVSQYNLNPKELEIIDLPFCYNTEINTKLLNLTKGNLPKFRI